MQPRTQRQKEILDYITRFIERHGYEPSYAQIARHFGISSKATIAKHIEALERRGLISRRRTNGAFALDVQVAEPESDALCEVPLLGRIAAGAPLEALNESADKVSVPRALFETYATVWRMQGAAMPPDAEAYAASLHQKGDRPASLEAHLRWLREAGFEPAVLHAYGHYLLLGALR